MSKIFSLIIVFTLTLCFAHAQKSDQGDFVRSVQINSEILDEERELLIYSPNFISGDKLKLPTIYLLDGRENMLLLRGIISNLVRADVIPPVNIVGINNYDYDRVHDLTPPLKGGEKNDEFGGGADFLKFINEEVFPEVSRHISQSRFKVIIGHSLGGLISTDIMLTSPEMFDAYLSVGGSYWYDDGAMIDQFVALTKSNPKALNGKSLYFSLADETDSKKSFDRLEGLLNKPAFNSRFDRFGQADHVTSMTPSIFSGLQFVFKDWALWDRLYQKIDFEEIKSKTYELAELYDMDVRHRVVELASHARGFTGSGRYDEAIELLNFLEPLYPEHIMVLNYLGEALEKKGETTKALAIYQRSLKVAEQKKSPMVRWIKKRISEIDK